MLTEVKVPRLSESVPDATLLEWKKQPGDEVSRGDSLVDLETDKVTLEVTATEDGTLKEILKPSGSTVTSDDVLAIIDTDLKPTSTKHLPANTSTAATAAQPETQQLSPAVRKIVAEHQLDPTTIVGTGKNGRLTKADVITVIEQPSVQPPQQDNNDQLNQRAPRTSKRVPMSRLRLRVAERLLAAQQQNAILTTFNEINLKAVIDLRTAFREEFMSRHGVKLGFMSFFTKAAALALRQFPIINASLESNEIVYHNFYDIGIAVSTSKGLIVPILRDVDSMSFATIEQHINAFGVKAHQGTLSVEDLSGGTFTITNGGTFGSLLSTPIINPPQSAILGMHNIQERPVAEAGQVVIRPMMYVALSYDHRIIDGREAVSFLVAIKNLLENPGRMILEL